MRSSFPVVMALICASVLTSVDARLAHGQTLDQPEAILQALDDLEQARNRLLRSGDAAVEPIVATLRGHPSLSSLRAAVLVGALGEINSPRSHQALVALLADTSPGVTAVAARVIVGRRIECAVPSLLRLLSDHRVYAQEQKTDPARTRDLTVAEAADAALAELTSVSAGSRGSERVRL